MLLSVFGKLGRIFHFYERRELFLDFQKERSSLRPLLISLSRFMQIIVEPILATFYRNTTEITSTGCMSVWDCGASDCKISLPFACLEPKPRSGTPHTPTWTVLPAGLCKQVLQHFAQDHQVLHQRPPGHQSAKPRMRICCSYCIFSSIRFNI